MAAASGTAISALLAVLSGAGLPALAAASALSAVKVVRKTRADGHVVVLRINDVLSRIESCRPGPARPARTT
jgi:hypothetical protein